jgi:hypothetical protein
LFKDVFGICIKVAGMARFPRQNMKNGKINLTATLEGIKEMLDSLKAWDGKSLFYGNVKWRMKSMKLSKSFKNLFPHVNELGIP